MCDRNRVQMMWISFVATRFYNLYISGATQLTLTRDGSSVLCPLAKVIDISFK